MSEGVFRFLESAGGAALITVALGSVVGTCLNRSIQDSVKEREMVLADHEKHLNHERLVTERVYELVGDSVTAAEGYIDLTTEDFNLQNYSGRQYEIMEEQRFELMKTYDAVSLQWRSQERLLSLQLSYYHPTRSNVINRSWESVAKAVNELMRCADERYNQYRKTGGTTDSCQCEKDMVVSRLDLLTTTLSKEHVYVEDSETEKDAK